MANVRIKRMIRELHKEPPLQFFQSLFALTGIAVRQGAALRKSTESMAQRMTTSMMGESKSAR